MVIKVLKLIVCGAIFFIGTYLGEVIAFVLGLPAAELAPGEDAGLSRLYGLVTAPLMALAIILVARGIAGSFVVRTLILANLVWIAFSLTNEMEGLVFANYSTGFWPAVIQALLPCGLTAAATVYLFPAAQQDHRNLSWKAFFHNRKTGAWIWRLTLACLCFAPVYFSLGLIVMPFVGAYYEQHIGGLQQPDVSTLFTVLLLRSVLFCFACLPVIVLWSKSQHSLWLSLGSGLSVWVGLHYLLGAYWLPVNLRLIHAVEIIVGEFLYTGLLLWLLKDVTQNLPKGEIAHQAI